MSRRLKKLAVVTAALFMALLPVSCSWNGEAPDREFVNTPQGNFMALWTIMDEHYCFFDLKKEKLGVDWNEVKVRYAATKLVVTEIVLGIKFAVLKYFRMK